MNSSAVDTEQNRSVGTGRTDEMLTLREACAFLRMP